MILKKRSVTNATDKDVETVETLTGDLTCIEQNEIDMKILNALINKEINK